MMDVQEFAALGNRAMRKSRSTAESIVWNAVGGRRWDSQPNLIEATHAGRAAANKFYDAVTAKGLDLRDAYCLLACASAKDKVKVGIFQKGIAADAGDLEMMRDFLNAKPRVQPVGVGYFLLDREKGTAIVKVRTFVEDERSARLLASVGTEIEKILARANKRPTVVRPN